MVLVAAHDVLWSVSIHLDEVCLDYNITLIQFLQAQIVRIPLPIGCSVMST